MNTRSTSSRALAALVGGAATALYYATPDFVPSRTTRGWAKAGLTAVAFAASVPDLRATRRTAPAGQEPDGAVAPTQALRSLPARSKAVIAGSVAAALAAGVGAQLTAERWIFRRGEARAAAGKRLPHTGPAVVYGALSSVLWLFPSPPDTP
ncbi:hypothetical protein ACI799_00925 [Blastococcus sp. SYSU DS0753]